MHNNQSASSLSIVAISARFFVAKIQICKKSIIVSLQLAALLTNSYTNMYIHRRFGVKREAFVPWRDLIHHPQQCVHIRLTFIDVKKFCSTLLEQSLIAQDVFTSMACFYHTWCSIWLTLSLQNTYKSYFIYII